MQFNGTKSDHDLKVNGFKGNIQSESSTGNFPLDLQSLIKILGLLKFIGGLACPQNLMIYYSLDYEQR